jgi:hypothetical protein
MQSNNPSKLYLDIDKAIFDAGFSSFYDYLETIVNFLESEKEKHNQSIDEISKKISSGEIVSSGDFEQMPPELEYDYYGLERVSGFQNNLFTSFFVMIYFHLEAELTRRCHELEKRNQEKLVLSDIVGSGVQKAITYLVKVHRFEISTGTNPEWEKIQNFNLLRNCIVHNQGKLDEGFSQREKLLKFIQKPNSKLELANDFCVLNKDFCLDALDTIKTFLYSVMFAKVKVL